MRLALAMAATLLGSSIAVAQQQDDALGASAAQSASMAQLLSQGYEIKAAVPNGSRFVVFMQKDQSAYACEFASIANTRCRSIN
ncbi:hypothetical protein LJR030_004127 [Rhizobium sp. LjRoot30]|uniref:hypothetical protein n=1 Tax=Rhizobium sp. LjRoot30 TaxID=3342320 RepID=UPI003ECE8990